MPLTQSTVFKSTVISLLLFCVSVLPARAEIKVVTSIKPVHSLVSAVMQGVGTPGIIVDGAGSPHTYALKPSQARMLQSADVFFWVGPDLEPFLQKTLQTVAANAKSVELLDTQDLAKLRFREGGAFEAHDDHDEHHGHDHGHDHDHDKHKKAAHKDEADHGEFDPHIWLDPGNAKALVKKIESVLASADPTNAATYRKNAQATETKLDALITETESLLKPLVGKQFVVFHDAYHYFENRFGVKAGGSITVSPEVMPGAERVNEIRAKVKALGATCVFAEPQFEPKLIATVLEGTSAKAGVIDPLGTELENGTDLYFKLIRNMGNSIKTCLAEASS
ncbi:MAG: zinc ABC transporter substrate-binding protein ZnuA [Burkholderiaceae bacterium]